MGYVYCRFSLQGIWETNTSLEVILGLGTNLHRFFSLSIASGSAARLFLILLHRVALNLLIPIDTLVWREAPWREKCPTQEHSRVTPTRAQIQFTRSGIQLPPLPPPAPPPPRGKGCSQRIRWGCMARFPKPLPSLKPTSICNFPYPINDLNKNSVPSVNSWGSFPESPENFSVSVNPFLVHLYIKQRSVYAWNFLYEENLRSD